MKATIEKGALIEMRDSLVQPTWPFRQRLYMAVRLVLGIQYRVPIMNVTVGTITEARP